MSLAQHPRPTADGPVHAGADAAHPTSGLPPRLAGVLRSAHLPALDGLRAVAVFLVIVMHFGFERVPGAYGVVVFFVISGFLITWLLLHEYDRTSTVSLRRFYWRRTLRIFPAFYVYAVGLLALLVVTHRPVPWSHAASALAYVSNYFEALRGEQNNGFSHTWSLAIEEQFYVLWPAAFLWLRRRPSGALVPLLGAVVAIWVYRAVAVLAFGISDSYAYAATECRADALLVGCALAIVLHDARATGRGRSTLDALTRHPAQSLVTVALLVAVVWASAVELTPRFRDLFGHALVPPLLAVLLVQLMAWHRSAIWSWTAWPFVAWLGRLSYSLYLYQQLTLHPASRVLARLPLAARFSGAIAFTVAVAAASYYLVERPVLRWRDRRTAGTRAAPAVGGPVSATSSEPAL